MSLAINGRDCGIWYVVFLVNCDTLINIPIYSFICSLLRAEVHPTLNLSAETHIVVQCTCPGRGAELVCVCDVCVTCGEGGLCRSEQLVRYF